MEQNNYPRIIVIGGKEWIRLYLKINNEPRYCTFELLSDEQSSYYSSPDITTINGRFKEWASSNNTKGDTKEQHTFWFQIK